MTAPTSRATRSSRRPTRRSHRPRARRSAGRSSARCAAPSAPRWWSGSRRSRSVEAQLEALVRGAEAKPGVEAMSARAALVARQLHERASAPPPLVDGPGEQLVPEALSAKVSPDPRRLDLRAQPASPREAGDERELQGPDDRAARVDDHDEELRGIGVDQVESALVWAELAAVPARTDLIVRD